MTASGRVVVVGGGISGLTAAYRLIRSGLRDVVVLEADDQAGGKVRTIEVGGIRVEAGADSFVTRKPWAVNLCSELELGDELVVPGATGAYVWAGRQLRSFPERSAFGIPSRPGDLLRWKGLPVAARLRAVLDLYRPARRSQDDEPLGKLLRRRLGGRTAKVMVEPLLAGLHAGDPMKLGVLATFPELATWERGHGSLIRGARAALKQAPGGGAGPMFATVWGGLDRMIEALTERIGPERVRFGSGVRQIERDADGYRVSTATASIDADAVVMATPAFESARLLSGLSAEAGRHLASIPYASTAVVILVYPEGTAERLPPGTGFVTPIGSGVVTACTWVSRKWPAAELGDRAVVRCFVGRAGAEEALELADDQLIAAVREVAEAAASMAAEPEAGRAVRWERAMPQYEVGHVERVDAIERALGEAPGVFVAGSAYRGVGIPDCVRQANETAERVLGHLAQTNGMKHRREAIRWTT